MNVTKIYVGLMASLLVLSGRPAWPAAEPATPSETPGATRVAAPPDSLGLDPFYKKCVLVGGLPIVASAKVSDYALLEAKYLIENMLANRPDVLAAMAKNRVRMVIMAPDELTTRIPEHSDLKPARFWDRRARGLGATPERPAVSCGEENLLRYPGDPYRAENILIHEFAHAIHHMGLDTVEPEFDVKLKAIYDKAMKAQRWKGKYAANNRAEFWAEGVQSWFDTNRKPDHDHNHVDTRAELQEYEPELARLIAQVLGPIEWRYRFPEDRPEKRHLAGYDPSGAPTFAWPAELLKWYAEYERKQKDE